MKLTMITTIFAFEICLLSTGLSLEILPEHDSGELDIFMEDEGYYQISRSKRADNQTATDQDDYSGESPSEDYTPTDDDESNSTITTETPDTNSKNETSEEDPPPDVSGNESTTVPATVKNTENLDESQSNNQSDSEQKPTTDKAPSTNLIQQPTTESINGSPTTIGNVQTTTVNSITIESNVPITGNVQASTAEPTTTPSYVPTTGNVQAGVIAGETTTQQHYEIKNDGRSSPDESPIPSENNSSNADVRGISVNIDTRIDTSGDIKEGNETSEFTSGTLDISPTVRNDTDKISNGTQIQNASKSDNSAPIIVQSNAAAANPPSATTTAKPIAGESDQVNKSSSAGSGILFTIIILVVVAGLAGLGYYMYKKRREGYDPVAVEDREREMTEVKGENGFGKPISEDEVKLADQMTPLQPQATPKTFGLRNDESDLESVQVIREDQDDSDRDQRERSVEIEEDNRKKDEEKFN